MLKIHFGKQAMSHSCILKTYLCVKNKQNNVHTDDPDTLHTYFVPG